MAHHIIGELFVSNIASKTLRTLKQQELDLDFPEHRSAEYRIALENRDSPPLDVIGLLAEGNVYEVVFLASQGGSYRLAYGNARMESPSYDTATLTTALAEGLSPIASTLGVAEEQPLVPEAEEPWWKRLLNNGPAMTALIAVLVLILASGLYRATRRLEAIDSSK